MTIKVIRPTPQPHITCRGCSATLEFDIADLTPAFFERDYTEDGPKGVGIECPNCKVRTQWKGAADATVDFVWSKLSASPVDPVLAHGLVMGVTVINSVREPYAPPESSCEVVFGRETFKLGITLPQAKRISTLMASPIDGIRVSLVLEPCK